MMSASVTVKKKETTASTLCPHKKTDFRYALWVKERKSLRKQAKSKSFHVAPFINPKRYTVTVDTSKARSNLDLVRMCLKELKWREYPFGRRDGNACDVYWHGVFFDDSQDMPAGKVNKFPGMIEILRKVALSRTLDMMQNLFPEEYDFCPRTWLLPSEFGQFSASVRKQWKSKEKPVFIVKPDDGSQGEGIYLIRDPSEYLMLSNKRHVVQEYLDNPLLVEDLKFDFRVYVVLKNLDPLEVYISREGLARFCTLPYESPSHKNMNQVYMHLTNYSLNKRSSSYVHTENHEDGSKRTLSSVLEKLKQKGYDTYSIWEEIEKLVVKTMIAIVPELKLEYRAQVPFGKGGPTCFQILGFDILLQQDCKPYLLEVNASPSLRIDYEHEIAPGINEYLHSAVDEEIKKPLVKSTLILIAPKEKIRNETRHAAGEKKETVDTEKPDRDDVLVESKEDVLVEILPRKYGDLYEHMRLMERTVQIFMFCLGVRGSLRMGPTAFRTFTRKCKLTASGFSNATIDILYIELQKRWEWAKDDSGGHGLCYQGFLEAFFHIARKKFPCEDRLESIECLLDFCESNLEFNSDPMSRQPKLVLTKQDKRTEQINSIYGNPKRRSKGSDYYLDYTSFKVERKGSRPKSRVLVKTKSQEEYLHSTA